MTGYLIRRRGLGRVRVRRVSPHVTTVMSRPVCTVATGLVLGDALRQLVRTGLRHLVVVDEAGRFAGVLVDRAIVAAWARDPSALDRLRVRDVVDRQPAVVDETATVAQAAGVMCAADVDAVAVVDDAGEPVGVLTGGDLAALVARS